MMLEEIGKIFKALADPTRRAILEALKVNDLSAGEIAEKFHITKPAISHHLSAMKEARLIVDRREGQNIIYSLNEDSLVEAWDKFLAKFCSHRLQERAKKQKKRKEKK